MKKKILDYTTRNLLNYLYYQRCYKLVGINLSRQIKTSILQQIIFLKKLEGNDAAAMFFIAKKQQKIILNFPLDSLIVK